MENRDYYIEISIYSEPEWSREVTISNRLKNWDEAEEFFKRLRNELERIQKLPKAVLPTVETGHDYHYNGICCRHGYFGEQHDCEKQDGAKMKDPSFKGTDNH